MAVADEMYQRLVDAGVVGGVTGWSGYYNTVPENPDRVVCILEYGGGPADMANGEDDARFQLTTRGAERDQAGTRARHDAAFAALHGWTGTVSGAYYAFVQALNSTPAPAWDENGRVTFRANFRALRSRT